MRLRTRALVVLLGLILVSCGGDWDELLATASNTSTSSLAVTTVPPPTTTSTSSTSTTTTSTSTTTSTTTTSTTTTSTTVATTTTEASGYTQEALEYFGEVAFGAEFGTSVAQVVKWTGDIRIAVHGDPTSEDLATLDDVVADLNQIVDTIEVEIVDAGANVDLYFAPESEFASIEPNYVPVNMGFFWVWWDGGRRITSSRILISTTGLSQAERNHLIREEVTQSLGLLQDSYSYPDSIFYQAWTETQGYSELDEIVIELLYQPQVAPGMTYAQAIEAIGG